MDACRVSLLFLLLCTSSDTITFLHNNMTQNRTLLRQRFFSGYFLTSLLCNELILITILTSIGILIHFVHTTSFHNYYTIFSAVIILILLLLNESLDS